MPTVPFENLPQVAPQGPPGVRVSPSSPQGAFGGGPAAAESFGQARGLADDIARQQEEVRQKADLAAVFRATAELSNFTNDLQYNQQTGIVAKKGENAFPLAKSIPEVHRKKVSELMSSLSSPEQRQVFQRHADQNWNQLNGFNQRHIAGQSEHYMAQQADAYVASRINAGALAGSAGDLKGVEDAARDVDQARRAWALKNGVSPDAANLIISRDTSAVYAGAIRQMLDAGNDLSAKQAFNKYSSLLTADDKGQLARMVERESTLGEAQRQVDRIFSTYYDKEEKPGETSVQAHYAPDSEDKALEEARQIKDPQVRRLAEGMVKERWNERERAAADAIKRDMVEAANMIDGGKKYEQLPASLRDRLPPTQRKQLMAYGKGDPVTDDATWYALMTMASAQPERFKNENLMNHLGKLSRSDFQEIAKVQAQALKGQTKAIDGFRSVDSIVSGTIADANLGKEDKERFMRTIDRQVKAWKENNQGKDIPNDLVEQMSDTLLKDVITGKHLWIFDKDEPLYKAESQKAVDASKKMGNILDNMKQDDRERITGDLKQRGIPLTESNILRFYEAMLADRRKNAGK
jgi:hypothetical protein